MAVWNKLALGALMLGTAFGTGSAFAADQTITTVVKLAGETWFTRMEQGVKEYGEKTEGVVANQVGPGKADAAQQIKDAGYAAEIKGITLQGMTIPTDRESQSMITGAVVGTLLDPTKTTRWQTATTQDGMPIFIELPAPQLQAIGQAVRNHVQRCFDVRDAKFAAVAVLATPKAVADWLTANLATDWPE